MRDTRKNKEYFNSFIKYQYFRIEKKLAKFKEADEAKQQRVLVSLTGLEIDLLKAEFSVGATKENLKTLLNRAIGIIYKYNNITYEDLLNLLSLAIIINDKNEAKKIIETNKKIVNNDRLLHYLSSYICGQEAIWDKNLQLPKEFSDLDKVFVSDNKESELTSYLDGWYRKHSGYGWYDSHLGSSDTYCGYWSFESAAIAKILGLQEETLKESVHYPYL